MTGNVFSREDDVIRGAKRVLRSRTLDIQTMNSEYKSLLCEYEKLVRQSKRLLRMGDRMQRALSTVNEELLVREQTYRGIFENAIEGIYRADAKGTLLEVNNALTAMLGYDDSAHFLNAVSDVGQIFHNDHAYHQYRTTLQSEHVVKGMQAKLRRVDDTTIWVEINAGAIHSQSDETGDVSGVVGVIADITDRRQMMHEMCRLARTDSLTGLWNRGYFVEQAAQEMLRCRRSARSLALLLIDVDFFKKINDQHGHDIGDRVLVGISDLLRESLRDVDIIARFGGEEFVVLLPDTCLHAANIAAERVRNAIASHNFAHDQERSISATVSIGVAAFDSPKIDLDMMIKQADTAMYAAKRKGRDRVASCLYDVAN